MRGQKTSDSLKLAQMFCGDVFALGLRPNAKPFRDMCFRFAH